MFYTLKNIPEVVQKLPERAQEVWIEVYNSEYKKESLEETCFSFAWEAVKIYWKIDKKTDKWIEIRKAKKKENDNYSIVTYSDGSKINYEKLEIDENNQVCYHLGMIRDDDILEKTWNNWVKNFESNARGQLVPLVIGHPFYTDSKNVNPEAYGYLLRLEKKGSDGFGILQLNSGGIDIHKNQKYFYNSPGWFQKWKHVDTGKEVGETLLEISYTNIPRQKHQKTNMLLVAEETYNRGVAKDFMDKIKTRAFMSDYDSRTFISDLEVSIMSILDNARESNKNKTRNSELKSKMKELKNVLNDIFDLKAKETEEENKFWNKTFNEEGKMDMDEKEKIVKETTEIVVKESANKQEKIELRETIKMQAELMTLRQEKIENQKKMEEQELKMKVLEEKERKAGFVKYSKTLLINPETKIQKLKKDTQDEFVDHLMTLNEEQEKNFKSLIEKLPGRKSIMLESQGSSQEKSEDNKVAGFDLKLSKEELYNKIDSEADRVAKQKAKESGNYQTHYEEEFDKNCKKYNLE